MFLITGSGSRNIYPVVVFIHGDVTDGKLGQSYETGSGRLHDGTMFAGLGQVIFVTLNYRLGILGMYN